MKSNVGGLDRGTRFVLGVIVIALGVYFQNWLGLLGVVFLVTAAVRWCPLYLPFGVSSCKKP